MRPIPFMLLGDGPHESTGLAKIARDVAAQIVESDLPVEFVQVGGHVPPVWPAWRHYGLDREEDWGVHCVEALWASLFGARPGILWILWDPARCFAYHTIKAPVQKWGYMAIDAMNVNSTLGGPARVAIVNFDRVLAYGRWASTIVRTLRTPAPYLPHGLTLALYTQPPSPEEYDWVQETLGRYYLPETTLLGCVATNQPRKDLGLFCHALSKLRQRGKKIYGWLHTDVLVKDWAIPQLIDDFGLRTALTVTLDLTDRQLALLYRACHVTIAPGLGEGFGYPIVESLAAGTPVVHGDYGGGAELVPKREWRFPVRATRLESCYALTRPVFDPDDVANAVERALAWAKDVGDATAEGYCRGAVAHLDWGQLWPRWRQWIERGLHG